MQEQNHSPFRVIPTESVPFICKATIPTAMGSFKVYAFTESQTGVDHLAIVHGDIDSRKRIPVRIHSECWTGEVLGSLKCDCGLQLELALKSVAQDGGMVIYLRQEGRGIGLLNKIKAYALQEEGLDTVEANLQLGFPDDLRNYNAAIQMLKFFGLNRIALMTNNPKKLKAMEQAGFDVKRIQHQSPVNEYNKSYLYTKASKSGHLLDFIEEAL